MNVNIKITRMVGLLLPVAAVTSQAFAPVIESAFWDVGRGARDQAYRSTIRPLAGMSTVPAAGPCGL